MYGTKSSSIAVSSIVLIVAAVAVFDALVAGIPLIVRWNSLASTGDLGMTVGNSYAFISSTRIEVD